MRYTASDLLDELVSSLCNKKIKAKLKQYSYDTGK